MYHLNLRVGFMISVSQCISVYTLYGNKGFVAPVLICTSMCRYGSRSGHPPGNRGQGCW